MPNGDIVLTWIPPADPGNTFDSYEVYFSTLAAGPFNLISSFPGPLSTTSYTHISAGGNTQGRYYYMKTKYGPGGVNSSVASGTLESIFVNVSVIQLAGYKFSYNDLHYSAAGTTTYSLNKEYPTGYWSVLGSTSALSYNDTISGYAFCGPPGPVISYQVTSPDNSGCVSRSNVQTGNFFDQKKPGPATTRSPTIDSVSVLPNGDVILTWEIPRDRDILKYPIYQIMNGANVPIDSVTGRSSTSYILNASVTGTASIQLEVAALDSCDKPSAFDTQPPGTMFLKAKYNSCAYKTELAWNPYYQMPDSVKEYRIYYSENGGSYSLVGTTTGTIFTHSNVSPEKNISYYVRAFNNGLTISSSSNRVSFYSHEVSGPSFIYLASASILNDHSAQLRLLVDTNATFVGLNVFRSEDGTDFKPIGLIHYSKKINYTFTDNAISSQNTSYYYKVLIEDSCGNTRQVSNTTKTILLKVEDDKELVFTKHLKWSDYQGFAGGVSGYNIYRVINQVPHAVGTTVIGLTFYTDDMEDEAPNGSDIEYRVEAVEGPGNPYGVFETSFSNTKPVYVDDNIFIPTAFAPQGINQVWLPVTHFVDKAEYRVLVFDRWGNKVFETNSDAVGWDGNNASPGIYAYRISYKNARGEYKDLTGTFLLYN